MKKVFNLFALAAAAMMGHAAAAPEKTAGELLKNVQVLKDVPASEWNNIMNGMVDALGVSCQHCHAIGAFEKDDQKAKDTARAMLRMVRDLNASAFAGKNLVSCYTCHQGSVRPKSLPPLWTKTEPRPQTATSASDALPSAEAVLARYRKAAGAASLKSLRLKGVMLTSAGPTLTAEIDAFPPDKLYTKMTINGQQISQVYDGDRGWTVTPMGIMRMPATLLTNPLMIPGTLLVVKFPVSDAPRKTVAVEKIDGRAYTVVESQSSRLLERLYFDNETGLLYRRYSEARSLIGSAPLELSFGDYRDLNGLKLPYLLIARFGTGRIEYRFSEIQPDIELDPARFAEPH
jgi:hypothetical protein